MKIHYRLIAVSVLMISFFVSAQDRFSVYGFMDFKLQQIFDRKPESFLVIDDEELPVFSMGHVNLYLDFKPMPISRALVEVSLYEPLDIRAGFDTEGVIKIERAWMELKPLRLFNIRVGKFITPAGIWNVDHASPTILIVNQPSMISFLPMFPIAQIGMMAYGSKFLNDFDLKYNAYVSAGRKDEMGVLRTTEASDPENLADYGVGGRLSLNNEEILDLFSFGFSGYTGVMRKCTKVRTGDIIMGGSMTSRDSVDYQAREIVTGGDLKLSKWNFTLQSELSWRWVRNELDNDALSTIYSFYVLGSYGINIGSACVLSPYLMFERFVFEDPINNAAPLSVVAMVNQSFIDGDQFVRGGLSFGFMGNYRIKVELARRDRLEITGPTGVYEEGDLDEYIFALQFSMAF